MSNQSKAAVKVEGNRVSLEVTYCIPNVDSGSNSFSEVIGGSREPLTEEQAINEVIESAKCWASGFRQEHPEVSVFDEAGNNY